MLRDKTYGWMGLIVDTVGPVTFRRPIGAPGDKAVSTGGFRSLREAALA